MHEPIEVPNQSQTMKNEMTVLKHFVILSKSDNVPLIHILSKLRCVLKEKLQSLLTGNAFVRHYAENVIKEWRLSITVDELLKDGLGACEDDLFDYPSFTKELECSQKGGATLEDIERILQQRQEQYTPMTPEYSQEMKRKVAELHAECNECSDRVKQHSVQAMTTYKTMDPHHLQVLIDLSSKPKSAYLEFSNSFRGTNDTFAVFLSETNGIEIPDTVHTMFLNYLITLNMIKKEMNYINHSLKQIVVYMNPKLDTLRNLVKGFTAQEVDDTTHSDEPLDGEGLGENIVVTRAENVLDTVKDTLAKQFTFF
jgi:hypothetical protein